MIGQVQMINGVKTIVPVTDTTPVDEVTVGNMQSVSSNAVARALSYSNTEQLTGGKWIDGKPIYKKTFTFGTIGVNQSFPISTSGTNIDVIIKGEGCGYSGAFIPIVYADRITDGIMSWYWSENRIVVFTGANRSVQSGYITLYYTKTA